RSPNRNDDNSLSPGQSSNFASHNIMMNRTPSPQGERNKERGNFLQFILMAINFSKILTLLNIMKRRKMFHEHKKTVEIKEPPPDPVDDFFKVVDDYIKTQTLIKRAKETRKTNRLVAWDFFHEEMRPINLESLYQIDKRGQRLDQINEEEEYIEEDRTQKDRSKVDEIPSTPRFLDVEMEDVHQFLTSPLPSSPGFRIFESMDVDETFPSSPSFTPQSLLPKVQHPFENTYSSLQINQLQSDKNRKPSIFMRLGKRESLTPVSTGPVNDKIFDKDLRTGSSMDMEYNPILENDDDGLSELEESIITKQDLKAPAISLKEKESDSQDEKEVTESQASDNDDSLSPIIPTPKLDLYNWVFGPPPLTRAQSGYQEKIRERKNKYKKPRFPD
ncbi:11517_t:CDS:2, partial [Acaulospora colombiana]